MSYRFIFLLIACFIGGTGMGIVTPSSIMIISQLSSESNRQITVASILSSSRLGGFMTTLMYLPLISSLHLSISSSYFISSLLLFIIFIFSLLFSKGVLHE